MLEDAKKVKSDVWITAIRSGLPPASATIASDAKGAFVLPNLPAGKYRICAQAPGGGYLDLCQWSNVPGQAMGEVTVSSGKVSSGVQVILESAHKLQIHLNDPAGLLDASHPEREIIVGVFTADGLFYPAPLKSKSATNRVHEISIPFDKAARIHVASSKVNLSDTQGASVASGGRTVPVTAVKNGPPPGRWSTP